MGGGGDGFSTEFLLQPRFERWAFTGIHRAAAAAAVAATVAEVAADAAARWMHASILI